MADKKKLTVAEMLAAARAADSGGAAEKPAGDAPAAETPPAAESAAPPAKPAAPAASGEPVKPATAPGGGRLSVAEMLAAAGLDRARFRNLTGGIAALHSAWRI